jgi:hypothetical protein
MNELFKNMAEFEYLGTVVANEIGFVSKLREE